MSKIKVGGITHRFFCAIVRFNEKMAKFALRHSELLTTDEFAGAVKEYQKIKKHKKILKID